MKYISIVILLGLMTWTWSLATANRAFSLDQYRLVESGVENDIRNFIGRRHPQTKDIFCTQFFNEVVQPGIELITRFRCQAVSDPSTPDAATQIFEGFIRLRSNDGFQSWNEVGGEIRSPEVRFTKEMKITPQTTGFEEVESEDAKKGGAKK